MSIKEDLEREEVREPLMDKKNLSDEQGGSFVQSRSKESAWMVYLSTFVAVCGSFAFGSCAGFSSPTENAIREDLSLSLAEYSVFGSILTFGAMIGAITSGPIADLIGRKGALRVAASFCVAGWLAIYFAQGVLALDLGRLATGYGMGIFSYVVPVFIAEISPKNLRGALTTTNQLMICGGVSVAFIIGTVLTWRALALTGIVPCAILVFGLFLIPESPRWLAKRGREEEFQTALQKLRGKEADISQEATEIKEYIETLERLPKARFVELFQRRYLRSVIIGVGLMVFQQFGGINGVCFYVSNIFESAGFSPSLGTIIYAILQVVVTALNTTVIDKAGRKPLLLVSASGLVLGCIITGISFYLKVNELAIKSVPALTLTGILLYIGSFSAGMGAVPWVIMSEIFPINIKGVAAKTLFIHEMLLSLNHISYAFPSPKTYSSSLICPFPKTLIFEYHTSSSSRRRRHPSLQFLIRSSSADNPQTLPHSAIQRIADKLRSLGFTEETETKAQTTAGEIFIPLPNGLPKYRVGQTLDPSWSTPENPVPVPGSGRAISRYHELRREVKREREAKKGEGKVPSLAELSLPNEELRRLRTIGIAEKRKLKVGKAGVTEGIVNGIHERWRRSEVVKIVCEDLCRMNMKRTHDLLERKTGGLVVWRVGSKIVLYRGADYKYPYFFADTSSVNETSTDAVQNTDVDDEEVDEVGSGLSAMDGAAPSKPRSTDEIVRPSLVQGVGSPNRVRFQMPGEAQLTEEADQLLDGLGPRFTDWWGYDPLPVDADLLPAAVPGYRRPFRLLPYGVKPTLTNDEITTLKRLSRPLPCHFALGRNTKHQGLAASIVKLWEKCEIAKIAVKRGVQNTNSELMAQELKWLTGGTLLSRDKEFIVLYRGKDFLPSAVSSAIEDRRKRGDMDKQWTDSITSNETPEELKDRNWSAIDAKSTDEIDDTNDRKRDLSENKNLRSTDAAIKRTSIKLSVALEKKAKAEKLLSELEKSEMSKQPEIDKEGVTEEERYMLRKIGLKMKPFLLMGRRGVFDGTIENMHLHWKYRELVKIICKERSFRAVQEVARTLEAESGGILVAVEGVSKGYAIILYRGKNYTRPACLRPPTLLSKRQAMKRSLEAQRRESLKLHVLRLTSNIDHLKLQLVKDKEAYNVQCVDESKFQVKDEINNTELEEPTGTDSELKPDCHSCSTIPADRNAIIETRDEHGADSTAVNQNDSLGASANHNQLQPAQRSNWTDLYPTFDGNKTGENEPNCPPEFVRSKTCDSLFSGISVGAVNSTSCSNNSMSNEKNVSHLNAKNYVSFNEEMGSSVKSAENQSGESVPIVVEEDNRMPSRVVCLSNRDRLLLRKQALKMKNRPVLAVGRSNIVTGVAKAIKAHFQRHPLAIVHVKGRAKGTSVQEVVSKLEEATGAVLVSQEPSKVILYRGWGAGEPGHKGRENKQNAREASSEKGRSRHAVSPELMAAIRLECGLQHDNQS